MEKLAIYLELEASSRRSSEMARNWRGICPAVDCSGLVMMMMIEKLQKFTGLPVQKLQYSQRISTKYIQHSE
jgi:hypothetical protein